MEVVGARLRDGVHRSGRVHSVLGGQSAGRHAEFLQGVGERHREVHVALRAVVCRTVEQVPDPDWQAPGNRDGHAPWEVPAPYDAGLDRRAGQDDQVGHLAPLQRQLYDPLVLDHVADPGTLQVDERCSRLDGHGLLETADRQHHIDDGGCRHLQDDPGLRERTESLEDRLQPIGPRGKVRQHVHAVRICGHAAREARVGLGRGDRDAGDDGAAFVGDAAAQLRRRELRPRCDTGENEDGHADEQNSQKRPHWRSPLQGDGLTTHDTEGGCSTRTRGCQRNREMGHTVSLSGFCKEFARAPADDTNRVSGH